MRKSKKKREKKNGKEEKLEEGELEEDLEEELEEVLEEEEVEDGGFQVEVAAGSLQGRWGQQVSSTGKSLLFKAP